jgi:glycosyltransferase involved in cell wall biosynthesis
MTKLKVLMISSDQNIFIPESPVASRMVEYGSLVEELHIIVESDARRGLNNFELSPNIWVYSTNSTNKFLRPVDAARLGKKIVSERKFVRGSSLITTQDPFECGWAGLKVKKKWHLPLEVQLHTDPFSPYFSGFLNSIRRLIANNVLKEADSVRVVSESLKESIKPHTNGQITVLPIFVDKEKIERSRNGNDTYENPEGKFTLLTASRLTSEKNLDLALKVLAKVKERNPKIRLVILGSGPEENSLKRMSKRLGLSGEVIFMGWQENLSRFYRSANIFIQTSLFEGYGLSLVEAGIFGLPIITTPVGIVGELEDGKDLYICPQGDVEAFTGAVIELMENSFKRENIKLNISRTLSAKLLSKESYLEKLKENWIKTAKRA